MATTGQQSEPLQGTPPPAERNYWWLSVVVGIVGVAISAYVCHELWLRESQVLESRFQTQASERVIAFEQNLRRSLDAIHVVTDLFHSSRYVERDDFFAMTRPLLHRHVSIESMAWIPIIQRAERGDVEQELQQYVHFAQIRDWSQGEDRNPAEERPVYFPVRYIEPFDSESLRQRLGVDHASNAARYEAMVEARDSGQPHATDLVSLPTVDGTDARGIVIYAPVYKRDTPTTTPLQRERNLVGFVAGMINVRRCFRNALLELPPSGVQIAILDNDILDANEVEGRRVIDVWQWKDFDPEESLASRESLNSLAYQRPLAIGGRNWQIVSRAAPDFASREGIRGHELALLFGVLVTAILVTATALLTKTNARIQQTVALRTAELVETNSELQREIDVRQWSEKELARQKHELAESNQDLESEVREREKAESALRESESLYHSLVEHLPLCVFRKDLDGRFTFHNDGLRTALGISDGKILGQTDFDICPPDLAQKYRTDDLSVIESGKIYHEIEEFVDARGERRFVEVTKTPVYDHRGKIVGIQGIFWDVTDRHRAEARLNRAKRELERSNEELEQFAHVASHDLQEPLRAISGYCDLLKKRFAADLNDEACQFVDFAVDGSERMKKLIDGLLEYSRVNTEGRSHEPTPCADALADAIANLSRTIAENEADISSGELPTLMADRTQITQLFQNLIGNAIKYRGQATPKIEIAAEEEGEFWRFNVSDNGVGIAADDQQRIFQIFQRLESANGVPGTGIGLSICKRIVERHLGQIWVDSLVGEGTTFTFRLPKQGEGV